MCENKLEESKWLCWPVAGVFVEQKFLRMYRCTAGEKSGAAACKLRAHLVPAICIYIRPRFGRWGEENKGAKPRSFLSGPRSNRRGSFVALTAELMGRRFLEEVVLKLAPLLVSPFSNSTSFISTFSAVPRDSFPGLITFIVERR